MLKIFGFSKKEKITVKDLASIYSKTLFEVIDLGFSEIIEFVNDNRKFEESPNLKMEDANWFLMIVFAAIIIIYLISLRIPQYTSTSC